MIEMITHCQNNQDFNPSWQAQECNSSQKVSSEFHDLSLFNNNVENCNNNQNKGRDAKECTQQCTDDNDRKKHEQQAQTKKHDYQSQNEDNGNQERGNNQFHFYSLFGYDERII